MDALAAQEGSGVARDYWEAMNPGERSEAIEAYAISSHIDSLEAQAAAEISEVERLKRLITAADNELAQCDADDKHKIGVLNRSLNSLRRSLEKALLAQGKEPLKGKRRTAESPATDGGRAGGRPADASSVDALNPDVPSATGAKVDARASAPRASATPKPKESQQLQMPPMPPLSQGKAGGKGKQPKPRQPVKRPPLKRRRIRRESSSSSAEASPVASEPDAPVSPPAAARRPRVQKPMSAEERIAALEKELAKAKAAAALKASNQADAKRQRAELDKAKKGSEKVAAGLARESKAQKDSRLEKRRMEGESTAAVRKEERHEARVSREAADAPANAAHFEELASKRQRAASPQTTPKPVPQSSQQVPFPSPIGSSSYSLSGLMTPTHNLSKHLEMYGDRDPGSYEKIVLQDKSLYNTPLDVAEHTERSILSTQFHLTRCLDYRFALAMAQDLGLSEETLRAAGEIAELEAEEAGASTTVGPSAGALSDFS